MTHLPGKENAMRWEYYALRSLLYVWVVLCLSTTLQGSGSESLSLSGWIAVAALTITARRPWDPA
ncbi:hypothetical protein AB1L88_15735 [Tautonia sp. JC769]|uniref:hypothetical protein n=1 Tax=Tautonia sp. JC769 TaxID=3232135 RepID=UPI00345B2912